MRDVIRVRFATNRNQTADGTLFGSSFRNDGIFFVTGSIDVRHEGGSPHPNWVPDPNSLHIDPGHMTLASIPQAIAAPDSSANTISDFIDKLTHRGSRLGKTPNTSGIVFLPGFDNTFLTAMSSSAQITSAYGASDVFCFSWPSKGEFG